MKPEIKTKVDELERLRARASAIIDEYKATGLPAEKDLEVSTILTKCSDLRAEIETSQKIEAKQTELDNLDKFLNEPERKIPHGINGDDDDRKKLMGAGWEIKGGMIYAPHSQEGKTFVGMDGTSRVLGKAEMFPEEVLFGDIPTDDADAANYFRKTRAIFSAEYKTAYKKYLHLSVKYRSESMALNQLTGAEQKALSEGSDTAGGFLVPPDIQADMLVRTAQQAVFRQFATVRTTSRDRMEFPAVAPNATSASLASIYSSGFVGGWVGETPAFSDTDPAFQMFPINVRKIRVATKLSNDFVSDAAQNVLGFLSMDGSRNMALVEDAGFLSGDGGPLQPMGLLNAGITTFDVEGTTSNTITNTTSSSGSAAKIKAGAYQLPSQYVGGARWLMRRTVKGKIAALVDGNGRPMWNEYAGSAFAAPAMSIEGSPVSESDWMPDDGADGNKVLVYGELSNYIVAQRAQISTVILRERFADTDQVGILLFERVGGGVWNLDAFRVGIV